MKFTVKQGGKKAPAWKEEAVFCFCGLDVPAGDTVGNVMKNGWSGLRYHCMRELAALFK